MRRRVARLARHVVRLGNHLAAPGYDRAHWHFARRGAGLREVEGAPVVAGQALSAKPFDPTYYTAYEVTMPVRVEGAAACMIEKALPEIDEELARMQQQLLRLDPNADLEENDFPMVGEEFATEVRVTCPAS